MKKLTIIFISLVAILWANSICAQRVVVVNMIPNAQSNETAQDREPNLAIKNSNGFHMVGTAFTPNPMGATMPPSAPIFFSLDGGLTWTLNAIVPSNISTNDITAKFGTTTDWLYAGILRLPNAAGAIRTTMDILRTNNFTGTVPMQNLLTRNEPDQPYTYAVTPTTGAGTGVDRLYVGNNDLGILPRSASVDQSLNASATTPTMANNVVERRTPTGQDGPPVRLAINMDGTIYAAYVQRTASSGSLRTANIVVCRDDNWGSGATPYSNLTDASDGLAGRIVVSGIQFQFGTTIGQERLGDKLNIAVDPNNSNIVYVVWGDNNGTGLINLHVRRSINRGVTWSATDLRTINNAINPEISINSLGQVSFSYQQLNGTNWLSIVELTANNFATQTAFTLNSFPDGTPALPVGPSNLYLGDYNFISAMPFGKTFCGTFAASNDPTPARFPAVQPVWQRNVDATTNQLRNLTNTANVAISIDPYFFRLIPVNTEEDFYVRDWTTSATNHDEGQEPSSNPVFYLTSDIWNRRSNIPGTFNANDQPDHQDARPVTAGHNFVYTRVHRRAAGTAETVNMLFMKSEFGVGSNYQLANGVSSFASLPFSATDVQLTMTTGVQWDLIDPAAVTTNHVCLAVEIAGPNDPSGNPTLLGRAPGWSNGTDLLVLADNNKAQRNLHVYTGPDDGGESMTMYAVAHNAAIIERDMRIILNPYHKTNNKEKFKVSAIAGNESGRSQLRGDTLFLMNMKPCENRWIELSVSTLPSLNAQPASYLFEERVNDMKINGFGIDVKSGKLDEAGGANMGEHAFLFERLLRQFGISEAELQAKAALQLSEVVSESDYTGFLEKYGTESVKIMKDFIQKQGSDLFGVVNAGNNLTTKIQSKNWNHAAMAHGNFVRKANAYLGFLDKSGGDQADIIQTIRWFKDVVRRGDSFKNSELGEKSIEQVDRFIDLYSSRKVSNKDYPRFVDENMSLWMELVKKHIPNQNFDKFFNAMKQALKDPKVLQKRHCEFVMELSRNVKL